MKITSFHHSTLGSFGSGLPTDSEGYVHLTVKGWIRAGYSRAESRELAEIARRETEAAETALDSWQGGGK